MAVRATRTNRWLPPAPETAAAASPSPAPTTRHARRLGICGRPAMLSASRVSSVAGHLEPVAHDRCSADSDASTNEAINDTERAVFFTPPTVPQTIVG